MEHCEDLLPDCFRFVRGVVDSQDLSLNISREMLQHDRQLKFMAANLEKKIRQELEKLLKNDREKYEKVYAAFGLQLKYGVVAQYGEKKDVLQDLLLFWSQKENKLVSLKEYTDAMPDGQPHIYYASGESRERLAQLPQLEQLKAKKAVEEKAEQAKPTLEFVKQTLGDKVSQVRLSTNLGSHPVCIVPAEGMSFEMEKYFKRLNPDMGMKADRILELNADHPVFAALQLAVAQDPEKAKKYASILYTQALLMADLPVDDPSDYTDLVCELMQ